MKKTYILCFFFLMFLIPLYTSGQTNRPKTNIIKPSELSQTPTGFLDSLLDPSKFSMSQSYSLSYFSLGNRSFNQGLYLNTLNYKISNPLLMQVRVGYIHQPLRGLGNTNPYGTNGKFFLQRAMLRYKPSDKMQLTIDYQAYPTPLMSPYYNRW